MSDSALDGLREQFASTPAVPPAELLGAVRAEAPRLRACSRAHTRRRAIGGVAIVAALTAASFTPPGRAATGWVAEVAGIGENPTLEQVGSIPGTAVVIDSGQLSDGTPFEIVAKGVVWGQNTGPPEWRAAAHREVICFQVDWPENQAKGQGGACTERDASKRGGYPALESSGFVSPPGAGPSEGGPSIGADAPGVFLGIVEGENIADVRLIQRDERDGTETQLPSETVPISGELVQRVGGGDPVRVFISTLDDSQVQAMNNDDVAIAAVAFDDQGHVLGRSQVLAGRCAELMNSLLYSRRQAETGGPAVAPASAPESPVDSLRQCQDEAWNSARGP
jgi:hypothetical protein